MQNIIDKLAAEIDSDFLVRLTSDLIRIPSYSDLPHQETEVAEFIWSLLTRERIKSWTEEVSDGRKNVYGLLKGNGKGKTLMLNGHLDTVPPFDMENALKPRLEGTKLFGRGAADMKGPIAAMIGAMIALKRSHVELSGDVLFSGVVDGELGCAGAVHFLESDLKADAAIVGMPSDGRVCIAHRGLEWYEFFFKGKTVHGGHQDEGISAISKAALFIRAIEEELTPKLKARTHPLLDHATVNIGVISGGTQLSTVAGECTLKLDRRFLPTESYADMEQEFRDIIEDLFAGDPEFNCEMRVTDDSTMKAGYVRMPLVTDPQDPFVQLVKAQLEAARGSSANLSYFPAWTDGGLLSHYGKIPTIVYGPGYIECCHSKDEYVEIEQLSEACLTYALCSVAFCG
jgi:acetylornithine deacetylase/succinyl-diaminopimelate desuccinylase